MFEVIDFLIFFFMAELVKLGCKYSCAALAMLGAFCVAEFVLLSVG